MRTSSRSDWPGDHVVELLTRAPSSPTTIADAQALAVTTVYFVASLLPVSAAAAVIAKSLQLSFDNAAHLTIPSLTLPKASFVGEGAAIPVVQGASSPGVTVEPYKLATMLVLTSELVRHSNAEAVMRQVLLENVGPTLDTAMFSTAAVVPGLRPAGILAGTSALVASTATTPLDAMCEDIGKIASAVAPAAGGAEPILVASPSQAAALALRSPRTLWTVLTSAALPDKTIVGVVPSALATALKRRASRPAPPE